MTSQCSFMPANSTNLVSRHLNATISSQNCRFLKKWAGTNHYDVALSALTV